MIDKLAKEDDQVTQTARIDMIATLATEGIGHSASVGQPVDSRNSGRNGPVRKVRQAARAPELDLWIAARAVQRAEAGVARAAAARGKLLRAERAEKDAAGAVVARALRARARGRREHEQHADHGSAARLPGGGARRAARLISGAGAARGGAHGALRSVAHFGMIRALFSLRASVPLRVRLRAGAYGRVQGAVACGCGAICHLLYVGALFGPFVMTALHRAVRSVSYAGRAAGAGHVVRTLYDTG